MYNKKEGTIVNRILNMDKKSSEYISFDIDERLENIQKNFLEYQFLEGVGVKDIIPLVVLLFFSMLPLHKDRLDRQKAMLLNAFRLYEMID